MYFATRIVSSLEKVFCCPELPGERLDRISGAQGERVAFQLACRAESNLILEIECSSPFGEGLSLREVGLVPCTQPAMPDDPYVLTHRPGLFPDALLPLENNRFRLSRNNWHALWCTVRIPPDMEPGEYEIAFRITTPQDLLIWKEPEMEHRTGICLRVLPFRLPEQKLLSANWFYADCVSIRHRTACWTEPFWKLLEAYFRNMIEHGNNVLYTPLWSVPLDTAIGRERPTAQLLEIEWKKGEYSFDFHRLERWIDTAHACGFRYFEMSHAFTQWGAKATPKIVVRVNGVEEKRFGWHVPASDPEYRTFLRALMEKLLPFFRGNRIELLSLLFQKKLFFRRGVVRFVGNEHCHGFTGGFVDDFLQIVGKRRIEFLVHDGIAEGRRIAVGRRVFGHFMDFQAGKHVVVGKAGIAHISLQGKIEITHGHLRARASQGVDDDDGVSARHEDMHPFHVLNGPYLLFNGGDGGAARGMCP